MTERLRDGLSDAASWAADHLLLVFVSGWIGANLLILLWPEDTADRDAYLRFLKTWQTLQRQAADADEAAWDAFAADTRSWLEPAIGELEQTAGPEAPLQQHLLWIGRDHLLPALDSRGRDVDEQKIRSHFRQIYLKLIRQGFPVPDPSVPPDDQGSADSGAASETAAEADEDSG